MKVNILLICLTVLSIKGPINSPQFIGAFLFHMQGISD
jgi:hypothetical protein